MWRGLAVFLASCGFSNTVGGPSVATDAPKVDAAIDAKPLPACPVAPAGCTKFECTSSPGSCYYYCSNTEGSNTANTQCGRVTGGCLVTINDAAEQTCAVGGAGGGGLFYFGFRQTGGPEPSGGWTWYCGTSQYPANWKSGEPNDSFPGEDCAAMDANGWVDVSCGEQFRFVCEAPRPAI